jgi:hypothetical protein
MAMSVTERAEELVHRIASEPDDVVEGLEDLPLELDVLGDGLDDDVGPRDVLQVQGERDPPEDRLAFVLGHLLVRHGLRRGVLDEPARLIHRLFVDLDADRLDARSREHLDHPAAHGAEADDPDLLDLSSHGRHSAKERTVG